MPTFSIRAAALALLGATVVGCEATSILAPSQPPPAISAVILESGTVAQVSAGGHTTCALRTDGTLACWGSNTRGQATPPIGTFTQVSVGSAHACAVKSDGAIACWGDNDNGQAAPPSGTFTEVAAGSNHSCGVKTDQTISCWGWNDYGEASPPAGTFTHVSAGASHSCGIRTDGTLACWGNSRWLQAIPGGTFTQVSAGFYHSCGVRTDGTVACWGDNYFGESTPPSGTFMQVSAGNPGGLSSYISSCGVRTDGVILCWGAPGVSVPPTGTYTQVSLGDSHSCALRTDAAVVCWGGAGSGEATLPSGGYIQVSDGGVSICGLKTDGTLACWGSDYYRQLTPPAGTFTQVSAGYDHTCALRTDGTLACWGEGYSLPPRATPPTGTFTQVSSGEKHSCAVRTDGTVACWGDNAYGQSTSPEGTFTQVSAGYHHSCGVKTDGTAVCWGANPFGETTPPAGIYTQVSAGDYHSCGIKSDRTVACWGSNYGGQSTPPAGAFSQVGAGGNSTCGLKANGNIQCWGADVTQLERTFSQLSTGYRPTCALEADQSIACWGTLGIADSRQSNQPPVASVGGPYAAAEGSPVVLSFGGSDPNADPLTYTWDLGDGTTGSGPMPPASHVYQDDGTYQVTLTVDDGRGGHDTAATIATVINVAPSITSFAPLGAALSPIAISGGSAVAQFRVAFSDPGPLDTHTLTMQCATGAAPATTAATSPATPSCVYSVPGVYTVRASVSDDDGGTSAVAAFRYVVIYDPQGPFATGAGFYPTTLGAGKAHFTFKVKFLPGRTTAPDGMAKFSVTGAKLDFQSTSIEMLVVSGNRIQFWGTGRYNGFLARFRITAVDGQARGSDGITDAIRIEIWNASGTLYDTQPGAAQDAPVTTPADAGSITIHQE